MRKVALAIFVVGLGVLGGAAIMRSAKSDESEIIVSNFVAFDFVRAVAGNTDGLKMLVKPGAEIHDFEPTPSDVLKLKNAKLVIDNGGESDEWIKRLLETNEVDKNKTLRLMDLVKVKEEELVEGMEEENEAGESEGEEAEEPEYDEHIWTSPKNAVELVRGIERKMSEVEPERAEEYQENAEKYVAKILEVDKKIREVVKNGSKKELVFGDRFPFRYFVDEYGLKYFAAFPGCASQTEASGKTVKFLVDKVKNDDVKAVLKIELSSGKLAETIAEEAGGVEVLELNAAHNIAQEEFERGVTYVEIMNRNVETLEKALR